MNSLPKTVNRQRRGCYLNPGPSAPESSMLTTRLSSHPIYTADINTTISNDFFPKLEVSKMSVLAHQPFKKH